MEKLRSLWEVSQDLAKQFNVPPELVEAIIKEWLRILYVGVTNNKWDDLLANL
jgi:hypothetical protein